MSALRLDPGHEPAQRLRKRVKEVEKLKEDGNADFKMGNFGEAIGKYEECLEVSFTYRSCMFLKENWLFS